MTVPTPHTNLCPKGRFSLSEVQQNRRIVRCVQIQIFQFTISSPIEMDAQNLLWRWIADCEKKTKILLYIRTDRTDTEQFTRIWQNL